MTRYRPALPELLEDELVELLEDELVELDEELLEDELVELDEELLDEEEEVPPELDDEVLLEVSSPPQAARLSASTQVLARVIGLRQYERLFIWDIVTYLFYLVKYDFQST